MVLEPATTSVGQHLLSPTCFDTKTEPRGFSQKILQAWVKGLSGSIYFALDEGLVVEQMSLIMAV